jgi:hypothetical protein
MSIQASRPAFAYTRPSWAHLCFIASATGLVVSGWARVGNPAILVPGLVVFVGSALVLAFRDPMWLLLALITLAPVSPEYSVATLSGGGARIQFSGYANVFSISIALYDLVILALAIGWVRWMHQKRPVLVPPATLWMLMYVIWSTVSLAFAARFITSTTRVIITDPILGFEYAFAVNAQQTAVAFLYLAKLAEVVLVGIFAATFFNKSIDFDVLARRFMWAGLMLAVVGIFHTVRVQSALPGIGWPSVRLDDGVFVLMAICACVLLIERHSRDNSQLAPIIFALLAMAFFVSLMGKRGAVLGVITAVLTLSLLSSKNRQVLAAVVLAGGILIVNPAPIRGLLLDVGIFAADSASRAQSALLVVLDRPRRVTSAGDVTQRSAPVEVSEASPRVASPSPVPAPSPSRVSPASPTMPTASTTSEINTKKPPVAPVDSSEDTSHPRSSNVSRLRPVAPTAHTIAPTEPAKEVHGFFNPIIRRSIEGPKSDFGEGIGWAHHGAYRIESDSLLNRINRRIGFDYSIKHRVVQQLRALTFFQEYPVSGVGFRTAVYRGIGMTDNQFISTAVETGAVGVMLLAVILWSLARTAVSALRQPTGDAPLFGKLLVASSAGLLVISVSVETLYLYRPMIAFWAALGIAWAATRRQHGGKFSTAA